VIKIEQASNGWIVKHQFDGEPEEVFVFENGNDSELDNAEAFADVLWKIKSLCGPQESRYSAHRVMIHLEPGDKHSSHPDNQEDAE
jgi:hypothetical protein